MNNLDIINQNIEIIKNNDLPIEHLSLIDIEGNFIIEEPKDSNCYTIYRGKIINEGVIYIKESSASFLTELNIYTETRSLTLMGHNIEGYNFSASTYAQFERCSIFDTKDDDFEQVRNNKAKITLLYSNYEELLKAVKSDLTDECIKEEFKLETFKSRKVYKSKVKKR